MAAARARNLFDHLDSGQFGAVQARRHAGVPRYHFRLSSFVERILESGSTCTDRNDGLVAPRSGGACDGTPCKPTGASAHIVALDDLEDLGMFSTATYEQTRLPLDEASTLPSHCYSSRAWYQRELKEVPPSCTIKLPSPPSRLIMHQTAPSSSRARVVLLQLRQSLRYAGIGTFYMQNQRSKGITGTAVP